MKKQPRKKINDLRILRIKDGDVVVVKDDVVSSASNDEAVIDRSRKEFMTAFKNTVNAHVLVLFVGKLSDVRLLDEDQMSQAGWIRKPDESD